MSNLDGSKIEKEVKPIRIQSIGKFKQIIDRLERKRKTIMLAGYSGSGKTTVLTVLYIGRDVSEKEVLTRTTGIVRNHFEYRTKDNKVLYIRGDDSEGLSRCVNDEGFMKRLKANDYFLFMLNTNSFAIEHNLSEKERTKALSDAETKNKESLHNANEKSKAWLQKVCEFANKNDKPMLLVLSHADEYMENAPKDKRDIRNAFLGGNGYLSDVKFNCGTVVANVLKYNEVREIIEKLIHLKR